MMSAGHIIQKGNGRVMANQIGCFVPCAAMCRIVVSRLWFLFGRREQMNAREYMEASLKTENADLTSIRERLRNREIMRLLHAAMGLCSEAGEMIDGVKAHIIYGKELDRTNVIEELGDLLWYISLACSAIDVSLETVMEVNIAKLKRRYPNKYSDKDAVMRDLKAEREVLEE
jgi:NTP pyrophosphatase (non-canonical NTP hydrolase)